jgi:hypothetical protein
LSTPTEVLEYASSAHDWLLRLKGNGMNQEPNKNGDPEMLDEYDFSGGVRGKYVDRFPKDSKVVVVLEPDVAKVFKDSESVNKALRDLAAIIHRQSDKAHP